MSYYSSSTLLDSYNTSSRYDSLYSNNTYNTGGGTTGYGVGGGLGNTASSAIDRYYSYLDDLTSGSSSSSIRTGDYSSGSSRYSSRYSSSSVSDTSGYNSSSRASNYLNDYQPISSRYSSTSIGRSLISRTPAYDKYGKELSNYDRWRLNHGESVVHNTTENNNNNNNLTSSSSYGGYLSKQTADISCNNNDTTIKPRSSRRISRIEDSFSDPLPPSSSTSVLNTSRELSVMPTASNTYPEDLAALPSRFAQMNTRESRLARETGTVQKQRGKSVGPNLLGSSYSNTSSSFGSRGGSSSSKLVHSFPISVSSKLSGYDVRDVKGDGGCYYRCLSAYFTGAEDSYNKYRREVVAYIRDHLDNYSSMIKSEIGYASTNDYFSRKMRTDHQEFAETTEIIATCCLYNINIHVLARVPGKGTWEWLHFDPSIGSGKPSTATRDIYLYNQGSVHFMLCTPK